jgi:hypothetical protein
MISKLHFVLWLSFPFFGAALHAQEEGGPFPTLQGPYLGQRPPGPSPEPFAFEIFDAVFGSFHSNVVFSPDGKAAYWQTRLADGSRLQGVFESRWEQGGWTRPQAAFFSSLTPGGVEDAPFISPDGGKFFFLSCSPLDEAGQCRKEDLRVMEREGEGWSEPRLLPPSVNALEGIHWQLSVDEGGNLYFGTWKPPEEGEEGWYTGDIHVSEYVDGRYTHPRKLGPEINAPGQYNRCPFIAPDGRYLLFNRGDSTRSASLFISFRSEDGSWTPARELSQLLGRDGRNPVVTRDGRFLFFLDDANGKLLPYWIDAGFIEELRARERIAP